MSEAPKPAEPPKPAAKAEPVQPVLSSPSLDKKHERLLVLIPFLAHATQMSALAKTIAEGTVDDLDEAVEAAGGYSAHSSTQPSLLYHAAKHQKLVIFKHLIDNGFSVDTIITTLKIPIYRYILSLPSTPVRDRMLRIAYESSDRMLEDYYRPMFKKSQWHADAAAAMKLNDFIYIDRILNRHRAHPDNMILNQGLMIHSAVINDCAECVRLILDAGGDPNHPYMGTAQLTGCQVGDEVKDVENWTPLMMAVARGNLRVIDALLESPKIQVCKGLPLDPLHTARSVARKWDSYERFALLRKLRASPADKLILEKWIKGIALQHLDIKFALKKRNPKLVEFLLHNCEAEVKLDWIKYAAAYSSSECLEILADEISDIEEASDLESVLRQDDPEIEQKKAILRELYPTY